MQKSPEMCVLYWGTQMQMFKKGRLIEGEFMKADFFGLYWAEQVYESLFSQWIQWKYPFDNSVLFLEQVKWETLTMFYVFKQKTFRLWRYRKIIYSHRFIFFATGMKTRRCPGHIVFRFNHVYSLQQLTWFPEKPRWLQINSSNIPSHTFKGQSDHKRNVAKDGAYSARTAMRGEVFQMCCTLQCAQ